MIRAQQMCQRERGSKWSSNGEVFNNHILFICCQSKEVCICKHRVAPPPRKHLPHYLWYFFNKQTSQSAALKRSDGSRQLVYSGSTQCPKYTVNSLLTTRIMVRNVVLRLDACIITQIRHRKIFQSYNSFCCNIIHYALCQTQYYMAYSVISLWN